MTAPPESEMVTVARIVSPHGRRGEAEAEVLTDYPERFQPGCTLWLAGKQGTRRLELETSRFHKGRVLLKFRGIESISDAETLRGDRVQVPVAERKAPAKGAVYVSDLMGCKVVEGGRQLGVIAGWEETGATPLLRVDSADGELLIPFAEAICTAIDLAKREVEVRLPEGLAELNRPQAPLRRPRRDRRNDD
jgi:16S rRNA processing protein RimM